MQSINPIRPFPALLLEVDSKRVLIVADLHIGWEVTLTQRGVHVPSQTPKMLDKMLRLVEKTNPTEIIFLGDVKYTVSGIEIEEWRDIPHFFEAIQKKVPTIQVIPGNHDGNLEALLPQPVEILPYTGTTLGDVGLFHGHAWPAPELLKCRRLVTAHVHPMVTFRDPMGFRITSQVWVKAKVDARELARSLLKHLGIKKHACSQPEGLFKERFKVKPRASQLFMIPSFNDFLGGRAINKKRRDKGGKAIPFIGPILRSGSVRMEDAEIYLLDGTFLGTISQLRSLS